MPTKITEPADSVLNIAAFLIMILHDESCTLDELHAKMDKEYVKKVSYKKLILGLDFLFIINKIRIDDEVIRVKFR